MKVFSVAPTKLSRLCATLLVLASTASPLAITSAHADLGDLIFRLGSRGSMMTIDRNDNGTQLKMRVSGKIVFNAAETDVESLSGRAIILEKRDGTTRRVDIRPDGIGGITRAYSVNAKPQPFDAAGKQWLAALIPALVRETPMNVDQRVARIRAKGGNAAVLDEIERIQSSQSRGKYLEVLLKSGGVDEKLMSRLVRSITRIDSDFERKNALIALINKGGVSPAAQIGVLGAVASMDSSFEQRTVLTALAPALSTDAAVMDAWREAVRQIDSDFETRAAIESLT